MTTPPQVVRSFRSLARHHLAQARSARLAGRVISAAYHLSEALEWRRHANRLRATAASI